MALIKLHSGSVREYVNADAITRITIQAVYNEPFQLKVVVGGVTLTAGATFATLAEAEDAVEKIATGQYWEA
ncbi:hypothetical protein IU449_27235 [Nocardia higoensis]|uniref:Uncharacterized protein n=1 Tax=Nocardia higoensis TaxID=228599 RepID=A0ABS0DIA6_9NOCA|nr:hypothetical protein [Nocardia higoensis]MBF6358195.1 hypothetical protein [Nocardia higoensis]